MNEKNKNNRFCTKCEHLSKDCKLLAKPLIEMVDWGWWTILFEYLNIICIAEVCTKFKKKEEKKE